jgi:hypothetical protein
MAEGAVVVLSGHIHRRRLTVVDVCGVVGGFHPTPPELPSSLFVFPPFTLVGIVALFVLFAPVTSLPGEGLDRLHPVLETAQLVAQLLEFFDLLVGLLLG